MGGASGAGSLLLNTKASQEAACSRAPRHSAGQEPESRDAGVSRFGENGSHLEAAPDIDAVGVQVGSLGSSGNAGIGSHLATADTAEGRVG